MPLNQSFDLAFDHHQSGRLAEAERIYRQILAQQPNHADATHLLGILAGQAGRPDAAVELLRRAVVLTPDAPDALSNLGNALTYAGHLDEAISACRRAIALKPDFAAALSNLGNALTDKGELEEAVSVCRKSIALRNDSPESHSNLGVALLELGHPDEAVSAYRTALRLDPGFADAHHNLGIALLLQGKFSEGWSHYEWRWKSKVRSPRPRFSQPQWDGSALTGRTLLLQPEQGWGDVIQFARYAPLAAERSGARVIMPCSPELYRLIRTIHGAAEWIAPGNPLPPFHAHCQLLSLPLAFRTTLQTVPGTVPYLRAVPEAINRWRQRLGEKSIRVGAPTGTYSDPPTLQRPDTATFRPLRVGLAWAGSPTHKRDRDRSMPLSALAPLAGVTGVHFYSLQKSQGPAQVQSPPAGMNWTDWTWELTDFADTAGLIANLDMVISVDTAVVHLAGAMGKPVWTMLPFVPDWRWLLNRDDSPWYPTMRLFRQPAIGDWSGVVSRVADALAGFSQGKVGG